MMDCPICGVHIEPETFGERRASALEQPPLEKPRKSGFVVPAEWFGEVVWR